MVVVDASGVISCDRDRFGCGLKKEFKKWENHLSVSCIGSKTGYKKRFFYFTGHRIDTK